MKLTIDVENTTTKRDGKLHLDPFEPSNKLVMVGCLDDKGNEYIFNMSDEVAGLQELLDKATILIGHNISYDLMWLWECGFKYEGPVFDTMLAEYILQRGVKEPLSLEACANRHELETKKQAQVWDWNIAPMFKAWSDIASEMKNKNDWNHFAKYVLKEVQEMAKKIKEVENK